MTSHLRILTTKTYDSHPSLVLTSSSGTTILINCGEGMQRSILELERLKLRNISRVCVTDLTPDCMGGLPGFILTSADQQEMSAMEEDEKKRGFGGKKGSSPKGSKRWKDERRGSGSQTPQCLGSMDVLGPRGLGEFVSSLRHFMRRDYFRVNVHEGQTSLKPNDKNANEEHATSGNKRQKRNNRNKKKLGFDVASCVDFTIESMDMSYSDLQPLPQNSFIPPPTAEMHKRQNGDSKFSSTPQHERNQRQNSASPHDRNSNCSPARNQPPNTTNKNQGPVSYLFTSPRIPGKFLPEKASELGVPPGPLRAALKNNKTVSITCRDGTTKSVYPHQVLSGGCDQGVAIAVLCVPNLGVLKRLNTLTHALSPFKSCNIRQPSGDISGSSLKKTVLDCMVHLAPRDILTHPLYCAYRKSFPFVVKHIALPTDLLNNSTTTNTDNPMMSPHRSAAYNATVRNIICEDIFPLPTGRASISKQQVGKNTNDSAEIDLEDDDGIKDTNNETAKVLANGDEKEDFPVRIRAEVTTTDVTNERTNETLTGTLEAKILETKKDQNDFEVRIRYVDPAEMDKTTTTDTNVDVTFSQTNDASITSTTATATTDATITPHDLTTTTDGTINTTENSIQKDDKTESVDQQQEKNWKNTTTSSTVSSPAIATTPTAMKDKDDSMDVEAKNNSNSSVAKHHVTTNNKSSSPMIITTVDYSDNEDILSDDEDNDDFIPMVENTIDNIVAGRPLMEVTIIPRSKSGVVDSSDCCNWLDKITSAPNHSVDKTSKLYEKVVSCGALSLAQTVLSETVADATINENNTHNHADETSKKNLGGTELFFTGTGSAIPCKHRNVTGNLLTLSNGNSILLDIGEGTLGMLHRYNKSIRDIKAVWISHPHADHHLGILRLLCERRDLGLDDELDGGGPLLIMAPPPMFWFLRDYDEKVLGYGNGNKSKRIRYIPVDCLSMMYVPPSTGSPTKQHQNQSRMDRRAHHRLIEIGIAAAYCVKVAHCYHAYALILETTGFSSTTICPTTSSTWNKIAYSGDCRPSTQFSKAGKGADLLIHEATFEIGMECEAVLKRHCTVGEALDVANAMEAKQICLTHFSQRYPCIPPLPNDLNCRKKEVIGGDGIERNGFRSVPGHYGPSADEPLDTDTISNNVVKITPVKDDVNDVVADENTISIDDDEGRIDHSSTDKNNSEVNGTDESTVMEIDTVNNTINTPNSKIDKSGGGNENSKNNENKGTRKTDEAESVTTAAAATSASTNATKTTTNDIDKVAKSVETYLDNTNDVKVERTAINNNSNNDVKTSPKEAKNSCSATIKTNSVTKVTKIPSIAAIQDNVDTSSTISTHVATPSTATTHKPSSKNPSKNNNNNSKDHNIVFAFDGMRITPTNFYVASKLTPALRLLYPEPNTEETLQSGAIAKVGQFNEYGDEKKEESSSLLMKNSREAKDIMSVPGAFAFKGILNCS